MQYFVRMVYSFDDSGLKLYCIFTMAIPQCITIQDIDKMSAKESTPVYRDQ